MHRKSLRKAVAQFYLSPGQVAAVRTANRLDMSPTDNREEKRRNYNLYRSAARGRKGNGCAILKVNARPMYRNTKGGKVYKIFATRRYGALIRL